MSGLLLGAVGGGVGGYKLASDGGAMRGKDPADLSTGNHRDDSRPSETTLDPSSMGDRFENTVMPFVPFEEACDVETFISWFQCRSFELNRESGGLHIAVGHPLVHDPDFSNIRFTNSGHNLTAIQVLDVFSEQTGISYSIRPCAVLWEKRKIQDAEQGGAGEPATRSESDAEGGDKPQPVAEGRSR
ncbi:MAG: hypothetical protein J0M04_10505 [Verrucomicrobia bacterium]|nr:hypothetical protein [Verrucomicrobiota bacterium]